VADRVNALIAARLDEAAHLLAQQGANRFRVEAYRRAATTLRQLEVPVSEILSGEGNAGLERLPGIGETLARAIREVAKTGRLAMLGRLRGESDPLSLLASVPGVGPTLAERLHHDLGIGTLEDLEAAAHDGRLAGVAGFGEKRLAGIRDALAARLGRVRGGGDAASVALTEPPPVAEVLAVDREYRIGAAAGQLPRIAPRRFNPAQEAWLPVLHAQRGERHYTALFSNTARAHELGRTRDWVVLYVDGGRGERQYTVITARLGLLKGKRVVRGREAECAQHYQRTSPARPEPACL
jgi:DNA polymerase (family 10)